MFLFFGGGGFFLVSVIDTRSAVTHQLSAGTSYQAGPSWALGWDAARCTHLLEVGTSLVALLGANWFQGT